MKMFETFCNVLYLRVQLAISTQRNINNQRSYQAQHICLVDIVVVQDVPVRRHLRNHASVMFDFDCDKL